MSVKDFAIFTIKESKQFNLHEYKYSMVVQALKESTGGIEINDTWNYDFAFPSLSI